MPEAGQERYARKVRLKARPEHLDPRRSLLLLGFCNTGRLFALAQMSAPAPEPVPKARARSGQSLYVPLYGAAQIYPYGITRSQATARRCASLLIAPWGQLLQRANLRLHPSSSLRAAASSRSLLRPRRMNSGRRLALNSVCIHVFLVALTGLWQGLPELPNRLICHMRLEVDVSCHGSLPKPLRPKTSRASGRWSERA